ESGLHPTPAVTSRTSRPARIRSRMIMTSPGRMSRPCGLDTGFQQSGEGLKIIQDGPVPGADDFLPQDALLIDDVGLGDSHELVALVGLAPRIDQDGKGEIEAFHKGRISFFVRTRSMLIGRTTSPSPSKVLLRVPL